MSKYSEKGILWKHRINERKQKVDNTGSARNDFALPTEAMIQRLVEMNISVKLLAYLMSNDIKKKGKRKVQGVPQSQNAALPRH